MWELTEWVWVAEPELAPPSAPPAAPRRNLARLFVSSSHPETLSAAQPRMPTGYSGWEPSDSIQITVRVGGRSLAALVPGAATPAFCALAVPVELGRVCECGWSAWG